MAPPQTRLPILLTAALWLVGGLVGLAATSTLIGCDTRLQQLATLSRPQAPLPPLQRGGTLSVAMIQGPATYAEDSNQAPTGFEYDLLAGFARAHDLTLQVTLVGSPQHAERAVEEGRVHMAAARFLATPARESNWISNAVSTPPFDFVELIVACNSRAQKAGKFEAMRNARVAVLPDSAVDFALTAARTRTTNITIARMGPADTVTDLLAAVANDRFDYAAMTESDYQLERKHAVSEPIRKTRTPAQGVEKCFTFGDKVGHVWRYRRGLHKEWSAALSTYLSQADSQGLIKQLRRRHFEHNQRLSTVDFTTFRADLRTRLPKYRAFFEEAAAISGVDWRLLAAIGYQESHWNPLAESPTGVRGLMMLTSDTADRMKVKNRLDARESILGGAKYFALMRDSLPLRITEPDRSWLALVAYNQGLGHLEDARILTQQSRRSADRWEDVRDMLPKLADATVYPGLRHGYARGFEALTFVEHVRNYQELMER